ISPAPSRMMPASTRASLYLPMASSRPSCGSTSASLSSLALIMTMKRMGFLLLKGSGQKFGDHRSKSLRLGIVVCSGQRQALAIGYGGRHRVRARRHEGIALVAVNDQRRLLGPAPARGQAGFPRLEHGAQVVGDGGAHGRERRPGRAGLEAFELFG